MTKILAIKTSMTQESARGSISDAALDLWLKYYKEKNSDVEVVELNLNDDPIGSHVLTSRNFATFWKDADKYIDQLKTIDKVVIAAPMTNFNYPAPLKNYFDHILQAKKTFIYKYNSKGASEGLLKHLHVQIITSQGAPKGWYPFGDHTISLTGTWKFVGATVAPPVIIAGTKTPEMINLTKEEVIMKYDQDIKKSAHNF